MNQLKNVAVALALMSPSGAASENSEPIFVDFNPNNFDNSTVIDNQWLPLKPGSKLVLDGKTTEDGEELARRIEFHTTGLTKMIGDVRTVVAYINDFADDELVESEIAFYAQDNDGNVWYFGEYPEEYEDGEFIEAKAWIHGFEDAKAGLKMYADPQVGPISYFQGWAPAVEWNDFGKVMEAGQEDCVPVDCFEDVLVVHETSLGEEGAFQVKSYAAGVGNFRVGWMGDDESKEELELVEFVTLDPAALEALNAEVLELEKRAYEGNEVYKQTPPAE